MTDAKPPKTPNTAKKVSTTNQTLATVKFCPKCQRDTERKAKGDCKVCAKAYDAARYNANQENQKAYTAAWAKANPERDKARHTAWKSANPDKAKATIAAWKKANPEVQRIYSHNRRSRASKNGGTLSRNLSAKLFKLQKGKCACCGNPLGERYHLDHIMPLALGGPNTDENIQLLRQSCNNQKSARHPIDFMQARGFLL